MHDLRVLEKKDTPRITCIHTKTRLKITPVRETIHPLEFSEKGSYF